MIEASGSAESLSSTDGIDAEIRRIQAKMRHVLNMRRGKIASRVEQEHPKVLVGTFAIDPVGRIRAEHPGADHHDVERPPAVAHRFVECAAHVSAEQIAREVRVLDVDGNGGIELKKGQRRKAPFEALRGSKR